jgi:SAM-dependent methyltransferase
MQRNLTPNAVANFSIGTIEKLPYEQNSFDHIICSAVLHFAESEEQFFTMFSELIRVLKVDGTILIRMASDIGLDGKSPEITYSKTGEKGTYYLKRESILKMNTDFDVEQIEPTKTTNVDDLRSMTTLMFQKKAT